MYFNPLRSSYFPTCHKCLPLKYFVQVLVVGFEHIQHIVKWLIEDYLGDYENGLMLRVWDALAKISSFHLYFTFSSLDQIVSLAINFNCLPF